MGLRKIEASECLQAEREEVLELLGAADVAQAWQDLNANGREHVDVLVQTMRENVRGWQESIGERLARKKGT